MESEDDTASRATSIPFKCQSFVVYIYTTAINRKSIKSLKSTTSKRIIAAKVKWRTDLPGRGPNRDTGLDRHPRTIAICICMSKFPKEKVKKEGSGNGIVLYCMVFIYTITSPINYDRKRPHPQYTPPLEVITIVSLISSRCMQKKNRFQPASYPTHTGT